MEVDNEANSMLMEDDQSSIQQSSSSNSTAVAESLWKFINNPLIAIVSNLKDVTAERMLRFFLESMLKGSSNFSNVLVPSISHKKPDVLVQQQYNAFATWLFGTMFHVIGDPLSNEIQEYSIEIQSRMLRVISSLNTALYDKIFIEYMDILQELLDFDLHSQEDDKITITKFCTQKDIIENIELIHFPVTMRAVGVPFVENSILKILIKSGCSRQNKDRMWQLLLRIIKESLPNVKVSALKFCTRIMKYYIIEEQDTRSLTLYLAEIVQSLPNWKETEQLNLELTNDYVDSLKEFIEISSVSSIIADLCYEIINLICHKLKSYGVKTDLTQSLSESACCQIIKYLQKVPRSCSADEAEKFIQYFENCPAFIGIYMQYIFTDIKQYGKERIKCSDVSEAWKKLLVELVALSNIGAFDQTLKILEASCLLKTLLKKQDYQVILYENELHLISENLLKRLNFEIRGIDEIIFKNFIQLLAHEESNRMLIQSILTLPFSHNVMESKDISRHAIFAAKSIGIFLKVKCLDAICKYGYGKERLNLLCVCLSMNDISLINSCILNSVLLVNDHEINPEDVIQEILLPVLSKKPEAHETLARAIGSLVCILTKKAHVKFDTNGWTINCEYCNTADADKNLNPKEQFLEKKYDNLISQFFILLTSTSVPVKLEISKYLLQLSNHVESFNTNEVATSYLPYMNDELLEIRTNISEVIGKLLNNRILLLQMAGVSLRDTVPDDLNSFVDLTIDILSDALIKALDNSIPELHRTVLNTAKNFVCVPLYITEQRVINIFLLTILDPQSSSVLVALATVYYQNVADFLGISTKMLYIRYRKEILNLMMQRVVQNFIHYTYNIATTVHRTAKCIGYEGSRQLLHKDGHYAICFLLSFITVEQKAMPLLRDIAELLNTDEKQILVDYFPHICSHAFLRVPTDVGVQCLKIVQDITKMSHSDLLEKSFTGVFGELMLNFHECPDKVISFLKILSKYDNIQENRRRINFNTQQGVAAYLKPQLHGILVNLDMNLRPKLDEYTQRSALASLAALMRFMGSEYLAPLKYKILATLRTSMSFERPGFAILACQAWDAFLHNISMDDLGPLLPTICVSILPLLNKYPDKVNSMLEFLIMENTEKISNFIAELFFIDDVRITSDVRSIIQAHVLQSRSEEFGDNLKVWLRRIMHETDEVRLRSLIYLKKFLAQHRVELNEMILTNTDAHPLIVDLLNTLLLGCQDKNEELRLLHGECLGELGAIEPSLLPRRIVSRDDVKFISDMNEEFACALLFEHVRAFQMQKDVQSMDCFSIAIQEILRVYEISPRGKNLASWNELPLNVQQIITPFLTSHYKIITMSADDYPHPIYGSGSGSSVESWAHNWLCSMTRAVRNDLLKNVLLACRPAFKRDMKIMTFCLPHVVAHIIVNGTSEARKMLKEEILTVISVNPKNSVDPELLDRRPLRLGTSTTAHSVRISDEARSTHCSQVVFSILDHLQRWLRERRLSRDEAYEAIKSFCASLDSLIIAKGCYQSREYHRALMYLEEHMVSSNKGLSDVTEGGLLAKIYAQLDEPDGVFGILATQDQSPTLQQLVLAHEVGGELQDAAVCYERLAQSKASQPSFLQGMIQCYLGLDQPFTAMSIAEGVLSSKPELEPLINENEAFWRLAQFTRLNDVSQKNVKHLLLNDLKQGKKPNLVEVKKNLVSLLAHASRPGAYQQSYSCIMKLHILNEFDKAISMMLNNVQDLPDILPEWETRGQLVRASRGIEFVLSMRRATLDLAVQLQQTLHQTENPILKEEIGKIWLKSAKIARKAGLHQQAYMHILSASDTCPPQELYIEQAQLYWQKGCQEDAFTTLKRCFAKCFRPASDYKQMPSGECVEERKQCAKAKLLFAKYNDETANVDTECNILNYKEAIEVWRCWEKSLLSCAQYYESVVARMTDEERDTKGRELQVHMMNFYGKSLQYGCKYIHQSMPKMLTIWLDFASRTTQRTGQGQREAVKMLEDTLYKMTKIMEIYLERLPTFTWLTAFSQLVSRICHPSVQVQNTLCSILVKLIHAYPQHCLWMMASVYNSAYPARKKRCQEILNNPKLRTPQLTKLVSDFNRLWERIIELSNKTIQDGVSSTTVSNLSRSLPRLLSNPDFSQIMIPTTNFKKLHLPSKGTSSMHHQPFSTDWSYIVGIEENVAIMPSLQRPRRIALKGSDGKRYLFMCKPKDDLRRDFRLQEFNDIVNKYLQKDPESRQRRLYIRTYSVVPLNEECGLIEWVPNLIGFRPIIMGLYKERGIALNRKELMGMVCALKDPLEKKRKIFIEKLVPRHPAVLGDWFRLNFPDPYGWYEARTAYIRTTAVMSMVGYILGLGDRHGENILFDSKCGDCVHVDFNCLFNRGELFDWPERVPFRLTHNMVEAMGPLRYEGPFRRACQITMRVLREQSSTLLSVLTPFVYDPLVSWSEKQTNDASEKTNAKAVEHIKNINQRLKGLIRPQGKKIDNIALNLSVEGQTNHLIMEATNIDNLCQMYFGWGAYM